MEQFKAQPGDIIKTTEISPLRGPFRVVSIWREGNFCRYDISESRGGMKISTLRNCDVSHKAGANLPKIIKLSEAGEMPAEKMRYSLDLIREGREQLERRGLRWNNHTGEIWEKSGKIENFSNPSEHVPHDSIAEVMKWEFARYINNEAGRIQRERAGGLTFR